MKVLVYLSRIFTGLVFVFSGFVKAVDPLGSAYKFSDYFNAFHLGFLEGISLPLAIFLSSAELVIGLCLLTGFRRSLSSWLLLLFMVFFTILTFILAIFNPVSDCGCFGDALILTNWQTFWKNIVLLVPSSLIFFTRKNFPDIYVPKAEYAFVLGFFLLAVFFSVWNIRHLPMFDFRPYKIGVNIPEGMIIPEGAPADVYETSLYYTHKKSGETKEFTIDDFPTDTTEWVFKDAESVLVKKGYEAPIHNFSITAPDGSDRTADVLSFEGHTFMLVSYDLQHATEEHLAEAGNWFRLAQAYPDLEFVALTASTSDQIEKTRQELNLPYDFSLADDITLKTIVRSNPGLLLIKDGTIVGKWAGRDMPVADSFAGFARLLETWPFCLSCSLNDLSRPPAGSKPDVYTSELLYRNIQTGKTESFTIDNFPTNSAGWEFVNSVSHKSSSGFNSPFDPFRLQSAYGNDISQNLLTNQSASLFVWIRNPENLNAETWEKLNQLSGMASEAAGEPVQSYCLVPLEGEDLLTFSDTWLSIMEYVSVQEDASAMVAFDQALVFYLHEGIIKGIWKDAGIPSPEALSGLEIPDKAKWKAGSTLQTLAVQDLKDSQRKTALLLVISLLVLLVFASTAYDLKAR